MNSSTPLYCPDWKVNEFSDSRVFRDRLLLTKKSFFQQEEPLKRLPYYYKQWENIADILPELISQTLTLDKSSPSQKSKYFCARRLLEEMPQYEINYLTTESEKRRAILLLGIFAHTWVWLPYVSGMSEQPEYFIPQQIAVPLYQLSTMLGRPPVLTNSDLFDYNWQRKNASEPEITIQNLDIINGFLKNDAEKYFYLIFFVMTVKGASAVEAMVEISKLLESTKFVNEALLLKLKTRLEVIVESLEEVRKSLAQVFSTINKEDWFNKVRWFSVGWNDKTMFPNGVIYEGVKAYNDQGQFFYGSSGFQYPVLQCVDAFLKSQHEAYINQVNARLYMPYQQVEIINTLENGPEIRTFLVEHRIGEQKFFFDTENHYYQDAITAYNNCIRQVKNIRALHFGVASKYLTKMMKNLEDKMILTTGGEQYNHEQLLKGMINCHNSQTI